MPDLPVFPGKPTADLHLKSPDSQMLATEVNPALEFWLVPYFSQVIIRSFPDGPYLSKLPHSWWLYSSLIGTCCIKLLHVWPVYPTQMLMLWLWSFFTTTEWAEHSLKWHKPKSIWALPLLHRLEVTSLLHTTSSLRGLKWPCWMLQGPLDC